MRKLYLQTVFITTLFFYFMSANAQLLEPKSLDYEQTGLNSVELKWDYPSSGLSYPINPVDEWIPYGYWDDTSNNGMASDGKFVYSIVGTGFKKYDMDGNLLETIVIPGAPAMHQITYDGKKYFYAIAEGGQSGKYGIYKLDMDSKELVGIIPTQMVLLHITYIPDLDEGRGGFEVGNPSQGYYLRLDGSFIQYGPYYDPAVNAACVSTAYYNGKIYAICQRAGSFKVIVEYDRESCLPTGKTLDLTDLAGHFGITSSQLAIDLKLFEYNGSMNALVATLWTTSSASGLRTIFFSLGDRPQLEGLQGYNVYRNNTKRNASLIPATSYSYTDEGLDEGVAYNYTMTAVYNGSESPQSEKLEVVLPLTNTLPLTEDFTSENLGDNRWEIFTNNQQTAWKTVNNVDLPGDYLPSLAYTYRFSADYKQTITSKDLKIADDDLTLMRFDVYCSSKQTENLNIEVLRGGQWVTAHSIPAWTADSWVHEAIDLSESLEGFEGQNFQIRLSASGSSLIPHNWYFDNIKIWNPGYVQFGGTAFQINTLLANVDILLEKNDDPLISYTFSTDENGKFYIEEVEKGTYTLTISKGGDMIYKDAAYVIGESSTTVELSILGALMEIDNSPIEMVLGEGKNKRIALPVNNDGNIALNWAADLEFDLMGTNDEIGKNNIKGEPAWEMVKTFELKSSNEEGLVYHKGHYYTFNGEYSNRGINQYTFEGEFVKMVNFPDMRTVTSDGQRLYILVSSYSGCYLVPIDFESGTVYDDEKIVINTVDPLGLLRHVSYDPVADKFWVSNEHYLYHAGRDGKADYYGRFDENNATYASGIAFDTFSEGGPYLWIGTSLDGLGGSINSGKCGILKYSIPEKATLPVYKGITELPGYKGSASTRGVMLSTNIIPGYFTLSGIAIYNSKTVAYVYKMLPFENWLSLDEMKGSVGEKAGGELIINLNSTMLEEGDSRTGNIVVSSNSVGESINIPVKLEVNNDMEDKCFSPLNLTAEVTAAYQVSLKWEMPGEAEQIKGYYIYRDGVLLNEKELALTAQYTDVYPKMGMQSYTVQAVYSFGCESYESESAEVTVNNPNTITPVSNALAETINKKHVQVTWDKPAYVREMFDDFESYEAFIIDNIGLWKVYDGDKAWTYYSSSISYPNQGRQMAYMVFNPGKCSSTMITPDGSEQMLAVFGANVDGMANNDWLISPEVGFEQAFTFSFDAKSSSNNYPLEKINVGYSLTGNNIEDFIFINEEGPIELAVPWVNYEFTIPAEAKYVAINCVSMNSWMCLFDNLFIGRADNYSDFLGYNIYRDGTKLNTNLLKETSFKEYNLEDGEYTYEVEALFANGSSSKTMSNKATVEYSHDITPPRELTGAIEGQHVALNWLVPVWEDESELRYDDGIPYDSGGNVEGEQLIGIGFEGNEINAYEGYSITGVQFYIADEVKYVVPFLFVNGVPTRVAEEMQVIPNQYITYYFDSPVVIEPDTRYIIGYSYEANGLGYYPASHDMNPGTPGKSDLISADGYNWYSTGQLWGSEWDINWNIAALVELQGEIGKSAPNTRAISRWEDKAGDTVLRATKKNGNLGVNSVAKQTQAFSDLLLGYKVYRNGTCITQEPLSQLQFTDTTIDLNNEYNVTYYVTAVYGESGEMKSNEILLNPLGIGNPVQGIAFYPNPAKETIFVEGGFDSASLTTLEGKTLLQANHPGGNTGKIDVSHIAPGVYILILSKGDRKYYNKLIIE